eukprot:2167098-Prymnesium_polylepis.1
MSVFAHEDADASHKEIGAPKPWREKSLRQRERPDATVAAFPAAAGGGGRGRRGSLGPRTKR